MFNWLFRTKEKINKKFDLVCLYTTGMWVTHTSGEGSYFCRIIGIKRPMDQNWALVQRSREHIKKHISRLCGGIIPLDILRGRLRVATY